MTCIVGLVHGSRLRTALEAAARYTATVRGPFHYVVTPRPLVAEDAGVEARADIEHHDAGVGQGR